MAETLLVLLMLISPYTGDGTPSPTAGASRTQAPAPSATEVRPHQPRADGNRSSGNESGAEGAGKASTFRSSRNGSGAEIDLFGALRMTASQSLDARIARLEQEKVRMEARVVHRQFYPLIKVEGNALFWDDSLYMEVKLSPQLEQMMQSMGIDASMPPMKIRGQKTAQAKVTVVQPLTPLLALREYYRSKMSEIAALKADEEVKVRLLKKEVVQAYFNCLKAEAYELVLVEAEKLLDEQTRRVKALVEEKVAIPAHVRAVELARSEVEAKRRRVRLSKILARQYFTYLIGGDPKRPYVPRPVVWRVTEMPDRGVCLRHALTHRPEFTMIAHRREQIRHGKKAMFWNGIPNVMVVGHYEHNEGFGPIYPKNAFFVGAMLQWDFQWNAKGLERRKLDVMDRQVRVQQEKVARLIELEISKHYSSLREHEAMLERAKAAVAKAKANYDDTVVRYQEGVAVLSDVLDARVSLTKAEVEKVTTEYEIMTDRALYLLACGMDPARFAASQGK